MDKLFKILDEIENRSLEHASTEADREYIMNDIERLAKLGKKIIHDMQEE